LTAAVYAAWMTRDLSRSRREARRIWIIVDLFVTADARRAGVGRTLMDSTRAACRDAGNRALMWTVHAWNLAAIGFSERLGATFSDDLFVTWPTD